MRRIAACVALQLLGTLVGTLVRGQATETETGRCLNELDDDGDGLIDCLDPDCEANPICYLAARAGGEGGTDREEEGVACEGEDPQDLLDVDPRVERVICDQAVRLLRGANDRDCTADARTELAELQSRPAVVMALVATGQQIDTSAIPTGLDMAALCPCACAIEPPAEPNSGGGGGRGDGSRGGTGGRAGGRGGASDARPLCGDGSRPACPVAGDRPTRFGCPDGSAPTCADGTDLSQRTGPACDLGAMMVDCAGVDPDSFGNGDEDVDIDELCEDQCISSLIPCSTNPVIITMMGADEAAGIAALRAVCAPTPTEATGPGDGFCDLRGLFDLCGEGQVEEACEEDLVCFCNTGCALEMMDCAESPALADDRDDVLMLQGVCNEPEGATGAPGDGVCSLRQASTLCDESELEDTDDFEELEAREERSLLPYYNCDAPPQRCLDTFGTQHELFNPSVCCQCLEDAEDEGLCPPLCLQVDEQCHGVLACEGVCAELEAGDLAELMEYQEEMCTDPCVMELIDCSTSPILPRSERAELVELRTACGADAPTGPAPVQLELTIAVDMASIAADTPERFAFERAFKSDVARAANVVRRRVVIDGVRQGSVVVTFHIAEPTTRAAVSSDDAITSLESAVSAGTLTVVGEVIPATALVVVDESFPPPAPQPRLSSAASEPGADAPAEQIEDSNGGAMLGTAAGLGAVGALLIVAVVVLCSKKRMKLGPVEGGQAEAAAVALGYVEHQEAGPGPGMQSNSQMTFKTGSVRP